jgi:hypothetical protein
MSRPLWQPAAQRHQPLSREWQGYWTLPECNLVEEGRGPAPNLIRRSIKPRNDILRSKPQYDILCDMKVEEIAEVIAKLPPDQLARFRRWFTAFEAGRADHIQELDSAATKLGRLAGRAYADLKRRAKEP